MRIRTRHLGRSQPFERDRRLVLHRLPVGAVVSRAQLVLRPYSLDTDGHFLETLAFPGAAGDWGASKRVLTGAVEVDLRARRRLASMVSSDLVAAHLLVDIGGGFMLVNADGGIGGTNPLELSGTTPQLPGLTVTGLRVPQAAADISALKIASPPSDVTVGIDGGPVFFSQFGDLVDPVTTPDFSALLKGLLPNQPVVDGAYVLTFVVHSGSIARLDIELAIDYTVSIDAMPAGVTSVTTSFAYGGVAAAAHGALNLALPPGSVAVAGASTGRAQGAFETSRVVFGDPLGTAAPENIVLDAAGPLAQPFVLATTEVAGSLDLLLTAVTADVTLAVDLVDDLDGKPGRTSLLPRPAQLTFTRDQAGSPTWLNTALPRELELAAGSRHWLILQAGAGTALWGAGAGDGTEPGLQRTDDGALSWRSVHGETVTGPIKAQLRLRQDTSNFHMPLELRATAGGTPTAISLQRLAAQGSVDFGFDIPEIADAVNAAIGGSDAGGVSAAEAVANGDFLDWYRVGTTVRERGTLQSPNSGSEDDPNALIDAAVGFGPDSTTAYAAGRSQGTMRFLSFDVFSRANIMDAPIDVNAGPLALVVDAAGRHAVISVAGASFSTGSEHVTAAGRLVVVDTATGRPVGAPVPVPVVAVRLVAAPDGTGLYLFGRDPGQDATAVQFVPWNALLAAAGGADLDLTGQAAASLTGDPLAVAVGADGRVYTLTQPSAVGDGPEPDATVSIFTDFRSSPRELSIGDAVDLAVTVDGRQLLVLTGTTLLFVDPDGHAAPRPLPLGGTEDGLLAVIPPGDVAMVVRGGAVTVIDLRRRAVVEDAGTTVDDTAVASTLAVNPAGTHALLARRRATDVILLAVGAALPVDWQLTAGVVEPDCLPGTTDVVAVLGRATTIGTEAASRRDPVTSALSQVVPATGGAPYRFAFDGLSVFDGAAGEVHWRGNDCAPARTDQVPITVIDPNRRESTDRLAHHQLDLVAPAGATQAEVRFSIPDGLAAVDKVSLAGSSDVVGPTWTNTDAGTAVAQSNGSITVTNGTSSPSVVKQLVRAEGGEHFELQVSASVPGDQQDTAIELMFSDEQSHALQPVVRIALDPLEFDDRAASGTAPGGASSAELRIIVPPGGSVEIAALNLAMQPASQVELSFVSDAPGELALTDVAVVVDAGEPAPAPMPSTGLCRPTPAPDADDGDCYCCVCGEQNPAGQEDHTTTDAGRPAAVSACPTCGSSRVRLGGRVVAHAEPTSLPRFRVTPRPGTRPVAMRRVAVPLDAISGIGAARAVQLRALGVHDGVALAQADVATVAQLRGLSRAGAVRLIAAAAREVQRRRPRSLFDP